VESFRFETTPSSPSLQACANYDKRRARAMPASKILGAPEGPLDLRAPLPLPLPTIPQVDRSAREHVCALWLALGARQPMMGVVKVGLIGTFQKLTAISRHEP
jgi:hypothetical protein